MAGEISSRRCSILSATYSSEVDQSAGSRLDSAPAADETAPGLMTVSAESRSRPIRPAHACCRRAGRRAPQACRSADGRRTCRKARRCLGPAARSPVTLRNVSLRSSHQLPARRPGPNRAASDRETHLRLDGKSSGRCRDGVIQPGGRTRLRSPPVVLAGMACQ